MTVAPLANDPGGVISARRKWALLDWLKWNSCMPRQRACQSKPRDTFVSIDQGDGAAGFVGLQSCGSIACPHCGPKIAASRTRDVQDAVQLWQAGDGRSLAFGTLTLRHHRGQSLDSLFDAVAACWKAATNGRAWRRDRRDYGIGGYVRVFEVTHGAHGWHVHVHFLAFLGDDASPWADVEASGGLLASMFDRWSRKAVALGLRAPLLRAQDLHRVTGDPEDTARSMGLYFAKQAAALGAELDAESIAFEVTGGPLKKQGSRSPGDLLCMAVAGDRAAERLWGEYELAVSRRRTIGWSRGLRDLLGIGVEPDDQEAADAADVPHVHDVRVALAGPSWSRLVRNGWRGEVLEYARTHTPASVVAWLRARDLVAWLQAADDPPD